MVQKDTESVKPESEANGNIEVEEKTEPVMEKTEEDVVEEEGNNEIMEETQEEEEKLEVAEEKVDMEIEEMNDGPSEKTENDDKVDGVGEEEKPKESKEERGLKIRLRTKSRDGKKERSTKQETEDKDSETQREKKIKETGISTDKKEEQKTPVGFTIDRPVRERKSVERLVAIIEQDASKEFKVEKGRGTALKDIPNVAYKLSRKKSDDTFKLLHNILFGRRGKVMLRFYDFRLSFISPCFSGATSHGNINNASALFGAWNAPQVKNNISRFSGFAWHDDEEDIISKLIEFLVAPHATTSELLTEQEQSSKGKKRKRESKSASGSATPSEGSAKSRKKTKGASKKDSEPKFEGESEEDEEKHDEDVKNNGSERTEYEKSEPAEHEEKASELKEFDEDKRKKKHVPAKSTTKKGTAEKAKTKKVTISKEASLPPKKEPPKPPSSRPKNIKDTSTKKSSGKKKDGPTKENISTPLKASSIVSPGEKILKVKDNLKEEKLKPSDNELRNAICGILKEVDFNTATFTDILKLLAKLFNKDLVPRKPSIKLMIQDELTKIADAEETGGEKDEGGGVNDGKKLSTEHVNT
ncbi:glutamic acid-rich protein [Dorcoceras hygrometricum]|uniref:Glutamic acid-rich protein n=1 Tax=Dorcoceras hygrometricum TaxID=472368 RepID=A0A2Z7BNS1_9LAMI|nr:glutamic acid-rich protein [Dorcoceras hygrometricum]